MKLSSKISIIFNVLDFGALTFLSQNQNRNWRNPSMLILSPKLLKIKILNNPN